MGEGRESSDVSRGDKAEQDIGDALSHDHDVHDIVDVDECVLHDFIYDGDSDMHANVTMCVHEQVHIGSDGKIVRHSLSSDSETRVELKQFRDRYPMSKVRELFSQKSPSYSVAVLAFGGMLCSIASVIAGFKPICMG